MRLFITQVSFKNFYNYYGNYDTNNYKFNKGLNIIVADNGAGKSKFFNGIQWILSDKLFDSDTKKYIQLNTAKFKLISDKAKVRCKVGDTIKSGVRLIYCDQSNSHQYEIIKEVTAKRNNEGSPTDERYWSVSIDDTIVNKKEILDFTPVYNQEEKERIIRQLIRPEYKRYALLQGEEVDDIVNLTDSANLTQTIKTLTNISKIEDLQSLIEYVANKAEKDYTNALRENNKQNTELAEKIKLKENIDDKIVHHKNELKELTTNLEREKIANETLLDKISNAEKRRNYSEKLKKIKEELKGLIQEEENFINEINTKLFKKQFLWLLVGSKKHIEGITTLKDNYTNFKNDKITDLKVSQRVASKLPIDSPDNTSLEKMLKEEICYVCGRQALKNSPEWDHIREVYDSHTKNNNSKEIFINNFQPFLDELYKNFAGISYRIEDIESEIIEEYKILDNFSKRKNQLSEAKRIAEEELVGYGAIGEEQEEKDKNILNEFSNIQKRVSKYEHDIDHIETDLKNLTDQSSRLEIEIAKMGEVGINKNYKLNKEIAEKLKLSIEKTRTKIIEKMVMKLEQEANSHFENLTKFNEIEGGKLKFEKSSHDAINITSVDSKGNKIWGLSEGFQRMRKIAVILAVISANERYNFNCPFIADAPLSSFGMNFIKGFFDVFNSPNFVFDQSIILVKELYDKKNDMRLAEIGNDVYRSQSLGSLYINEIEKSLPQTERSTKIFTYKN